MSPRTKGKVRCTRYSIMALRICSLVGACGMLFCVICIRNTDAMTGWIIRIPAGIAILHLVYAIYHLARSSRGRTPASSASYMLFAAVIDISLIPFYVFAALMARTEYVEPVEARNRWLTLFKNDIATYKIIYSTFLVSVVCGSLHLVSFILSLYLGVLYRKIARLPPDMNPLEDNLTSRHKRNKSSLSENRSSQVSTINMKDKAEHQVGNTPISSALTVPFMQTRNDSHFDTFNDLCPRDSPRSSCSNIPRSARCEQRPSKWDSSSNLASNASPFQYQTPRNNDLRAKLMSSTSKPPQPTVSDFVPKESLTNRETPCQAYSQDRSQPIYRSLTKSSSIYSFDTDSATKTAVNARPRYSNDPSLLDSDRLTLATPRQLKNLDKKANYQLLSQVTYGECLDHENLHITENPLEMNPPTPTKGQQVAWTAKHGQRALTPSDGNVRRQDSWNQGPGSLGIGKARAWDGPIRPLERRNERTRVVSRSGVQIRGEGILPSGGVRAREVSGKVMEEGRETGNLMGNWHHTAERSVAM